MIARIHKSMQDKDKGFTLIELLVVVIIIGILAAIAIPMFMNQRKKAWEKQVISDIRGATTAMEALATDNNGTYSAPKATYTNADNAATGDDLVDAGLRVTEGVTLTITVAADGSSYEISGIHESLTGDQWTYSSVLGTTEKGDAAGGGE